jgi:hypothetical protein
MPPVNQPPIGLTDQEILCVIAALQTLGGTPTVTMKTTHRYLGGAATPGGAQPAAAPPGAQPPSSPKKGAQLLRSFEGAVAFPQPVAAHQASTQLDGAAR